MAKKKNIFNQSMLDRLSSPDQLDKMVVVTPVPVWLFIAGGLLTVIVALGWAITSWMSVTTPANGVYLPQGQSYSLSSSQAGIVREVYVEKGQEIKKGDKIFSFDASDAEDTIRELEERRSAVEAITLDSTGDKATQDTGDLINLKIQIGSSGVESDKSQVNVDAYEEQLSELKSDLSKAKSACEKAEKAYESAASRYQSGKMTAEKFKSYEEKYQTAQQDYASLKSQKESLEQQVAAAKAQKKAAGVGEKSQKEALIEQFNATREGLLDSLDSQIASNRETVKDGTVKAKISGEITELKIAPGSAVGQGSEYITIREKAKGDGIIQCYIPVESGKSVTEGMDVIIYPTNVNRQEYGHMEATVVSVDDYVASALEIRQALGDESFANAFMQQGPVIGVKCKLRKDKTTASGYYWSSKKGRELVLPSATIVTADIVVEKMHPIENLIPFIREKADDFVSPEEDQTENHEQ